MTYTLEERKIPRTMSTQHPDNVNVPEWSQGPVIDGNAEVFEAFFAYNTLGCQEVMWDSEGKDVDTRVVRKLLSNHWDYFSKNELGKDLFLTYRIPNPTAESVEKKVVVETLQNIPVTSDVATLAYKKEVTPIFEVILPFTTTSSEPIWLYNYYRKSIIANEEIFLDETTKAKDWIGTSKPKKIEVIPLVEDFNSLANVDKIIEPYIHVVKPKSLRVFLARSDPALNYGLICAVLLQKIALSKLKETSRKKNLSIHPIIGVGSKPFRGHLSPDNLDKFLQEYKGLSTVTVQSAARYDYPIDQTKAFVKALNERLPNGESETVEPHEEKVLLTAMSKCMKRYGEVVEALAPLVNSLSAYVPQRRARKLHIGLFGYSRKIGGISLPRAIPFAAALYSIGIPPEIIGSRVLDELNDEEWGIVKKYYVNCSHDIVSIGGYVSWDNINLLLETHEQASAKANMSVEKLETAVTKILEDLKTVEEKLVIKLGPRTPSQKRHGNFTNNFLISYIERDNPEEARLDLIEAAKIRKCLG
jgi:phosphoenolpyruvate carboxylase